VVALLGEERWGMIAGLLTIDKRKLNELKNIYTVVR